ncbi:MAG: type IV pilus twitching motility protein PilT [Gammaproteobacteria bacterium]
MELGQLLERLVIARGSDLHLVSGDPPRMRLYGDLKTVSDHRLSVSDTSELLFSIMSGRIRNAFELNDNIDFSYMIEGLARFRVNVFRHLDGIGGVFRAIPTSTLSIEQLSLPAVLGSMASQKQGLVLVTGKTGSGKSTTLAAMIDSINRNIKGHIITIEDPIEFMHPRRKCLISQREIGTHTPSFASALRSALREDPDVILVGEMRDLETMSLAVTAAETGILVLATLHTNSAPTTVDRIINTFPVEKQSHIRTMLSTSLRGVASQQLVKRADGEGRVAAVEVMINTPAVANIIREGKTDQIENAIQSGALLGMQSMDNALRKLVDSQVITGRDAYTNCFDKTAFEQYVQDQDNQGPMQAS